jgi:hypothetical protein
LTKAGARLSCIICAGQLPRNAGANVNFVYTVNINRSASATPAAYFPRAFTSQAL